MKSSASGAFATNSTWPGAGIGASRKPPDYSIGEALMKRPWKSSDEPGRPGAVSAETATWRLGLLRIQVPYSIGAVKATADEE
jgi:hypothetical protein